MVQKYELKFLLAYWLHPHVLSLPTKIPLPRYCVKNKEVKTFHGCRVLHLCTVLNASSY